LAVDYPLQGIFFSAGADPCNSCSFQLLIQFLAADTFPVPAADSCQLFFLSVEQLFPISVVDVQLLFLPDVDHFQSADPMQYFLFSVFDRKLLIHLKILPLFS
jgi:hypothetical protein